MRELYGLAFDPIGADGCEGSNALSTTLLNSCATREKVLAALDEKIASLQPGDTLLFYFAGHGSQYRDDDNYDQDSGYNGTILPYDARNPNGTPGEIFDIELKERKNRATAAGIYFVSIFDSCNSATATRNGAIGTSRSVPPLEGGAVPAQLQSVAPPQRSAQNEGYWVHLAAAQDGEEAQEAPSGAVGERAGVFTNALIDTLRRPSMRFATFGDIIREVQLRVANNGHTSQSPSAEGNLTASWGSRSHSKVLFEAKPVGADVELLAGSLSGMTVGSTFALYASQDDAIRKNNRLATGAIVEVSAVTSRLQIEPEGSAPLPAAMFAEQTAHFLPADTLQVVNRLPAGGERDTVERALDRLGFAARASNGGIHIVGSDDKPGLALLQAADGTSIAELGAVADEAFAARLEAELKKVARVNQLLALRTSFQTGSADEDGGPVEFCIAAEGYRPTGCPPPDRGGLRYIDLGERAVATVINRGSKPQYIYLMAIDPMNGVVQILPRPGEIDRKIEPNRPYRRGPMSFQLRGKYRFITIASDERIRVDAFQQSGSGVRDIAACVTPLERLLCSASQGIRDANVTAVDDWSASVSPAIVE
jgi:hypothetical protein